MVSYIVSNICEVIWKKNVNGGLSNVIFWRVEHLDRAEKKFKIAFLSDQPFTEQISSKYLYHLYHETVIWRGLILASFNSSSICSTRPKYVHHIVCFFWLNRHRLFCYAGYGPAINSHLKEGENAFQMFLSKQINLKYDI